MHWQIAIDGRHCHPFVTRLSEMRRAARATWTQEQLLSWTKKQRRIRLPLRQWSCLAIVDTRDVVDTCALARVGLVPVPGLCGSAVLEIVANPGGIR